MSDDEIISVTVACAMKIHSELGPGLFEAVYKECLQYELEKKGFSVEREKSLPFIYQDIKLNLGYRMDLIIENRVVVEIKSVDVLNALHLAQTLTYLRLSGNRFGLLINFNVARLKDGLKRVVNGF